MTFFLRAKHWQIFLVVMLVLYGGQIPLLISELNPQLSPANIAETLFLNLCVVLSLAGILAWLWSLGSFLNSISRHRMKRNLFQFALMYSILYFTFFVFVATFQKPIPMTSTIMIPLHLFSMACLIYIVHFVSKNLVSAETDQPLFHRYGFNFLLIVFFPVGIWIIQPQINRLFANRCH